MLRAFFIVCVLVGAQARIRIRLVSSLAKYASSGSSSTGHSVALNPPSRHYYSPPEHISYGTTSHPVYQQVPPGYVYEYRNSGSRFDALLTGLALYNLGRISAQNNNTEREYHSHPGEVCMMRIVQTTGDYEEMRFDCKLMSSFIWEADSKQQQQSQERSEVTTTTVKDALQVKGPSIEVVPGMKCYMIWFSRDYSEESPLEKEVECGLLQAYAVYSFRNNCRKVPALVLVLLSSTIFLFLYR